MRRSVLAACALGFVALGGCAVGVQSGDDDGLGIGFDATVDGPRPAHDAAPSATSVDAAQPPGDDAATDEGGASDGGLDDGGGVDGGPPPSTCNAGDSCATATMIGSVSADNGGSTSTSGTASQWLVIDATEDNNGIFAEGMNLAVTLQSPPGENFDLYVYMGGSPGAVECTSVAQSSSNGPGQADTVNLSWGESGLFSNGKDDSRMVTIEVRSASGNVCASGSTWSLTVTGG